MLNFLLEIGTEELPTDFIDNAILSWKTRIGENLATEFIPAEKVEVYGTPRRLAVLIKGILANKRIGKKKLKVLQSKQLLKMVNPLKQQKVLLASKEYH